MGDEQDHSGPQTVPEPFRTTAERIVKAEQDKCFGEMNGCIRNIRNGDCGQAGGSLVDAITHALEDAAGALLSRTSDDMASAVMAVLNERLASYAEMQARNDLTDLGRHGLLVTNNIKRDVEFALERISSTVTRPHQPGGDQ